MTIGKELIRIAESLRVNRREPKLAEELVKFAQAIDSESFDPSAETPNTNPLLADQGQPQQQEPAPHSSAAGDQAQNNPLGNKFLPEQPKNKVVHVLTIRLEAPENVTRQQMVNYIDDIEGALGVKPVGLEWGMKESK